VGCRVRGGGAGRQEGVGQRRRRVERGRYRVYCGVRISRGFRVAVERALLVCFRHRSFVVETALTSHRHVKLVMP
jgi:hypothetical protein